jgi:signal peptidase II
MKFHVYFILMVLCGVAIDLVTKYAVFAYIGAGASYEFLPGILHITGAANTGVAFSLFSGKTLLITGASCVAILWLLYTYSQHWREGSPVLLSALGLILMGAIGNMVDRLWLGYVRDFIDFVPAIPLVGHWPVFNVADIGITVGVALYLLWELLLREPAAANSSAPAAVPPREEPAQQAAGGDAQDPCAAQGTETKHA